VRACRKAVEFRLNERTRRPVSIFSQIYAKTSFSRRKAKHDPVRPLWNGVIAIARDPEWYVQRGLADTLPGRFDAVTLFLALVLLRMEREPELIAPSVLLTELFVEDMDGQLRQAGVGDLVVGKRIGKLMSVLGGRLGALRDALPLGETALATVLERNLTVNQGASAASMAGPVLAFAERLAQISAADLLAGRIAR
jgi:cytochrome b pre-mRNA-processing protein 3